MDDDKLQKILNDFYKNATPDEIKTLDKLLEDRNDFTRPLDLNVDKMASDMASNIKDQMGITQESIMASAREIVTTMILQYDPFIIKSDLKVLVNHILPPKKKTVKMPPDIVLSMITHFVMYSTGRMPQEEIDELPEGWTEKYWFSFPEDVQRLIAAFLKEQIPEDDFWEMVQTLLAGN